MQARQDRPNQGTEKAQAANMASNRIGLTLAILTGTWVQFAAAQNGSPHAAPLALVTTVQPGLAAGAVFKEIDDPGSGLRWLLIEDPAHPGGPGRLVISGEGKMVDQSRGGKAVDQSRPSAATAIKSNPVIHAGEAVQLEEHTAVVNASLQAVALGSAIQGGTLRVRLRVGGRVFEARALGPGRAALEPAGEKP